MYGHSRDVICPLKIKRKQTTPVIDRWNKRQDKKKENKKFTILFH